jgi:hypothetical protein
MQRPGHSWIVSYRARGKPSCCELPRLLLVFLHIAGDRKTARLTLAHGAEEFALSNTALHEPTHNLPDGCGRIFHRRCENNRRLQTNQHQLLITC